MNEEEEARADRVWEEVRSFVFLIMKLVWLFPLIYLLYQCNYG